jgi:murein DD-endopeptidase MepM/ murein hydrolase activator NlpD
MASWKKLLVVVPSDGSPVRSVRLRMALVLFVSLLVLAGFGGYFIPLSSTTINAVEKNEKNNLKQQNVKLGQISTDAFRLSGLLRKDLKNLEKKVEQLQNASALSSPAPEPEHPVVPFKRTQLSFSKVNEICAANETDIIRFYKVLTASPAILNSLPVMYPVVNCHTITNRFGRMSDPFTNMVKFHYGNDFVAEPETPIVATAAGTVSLVENDRLWGKRIIITHGLGFSTVYAHLGSISVFPGKKVKKGDLIATVGISGTTTGPHLHYEIWRSGKAINPEDYYFPDLESFFTTVLGITTTVLGITGPATSG